MTITPTPNSPKPPETKTPTPLFDPLLQEETTALMETIRRRTIEEAELAGEMTREAYLNAVRQLRETVEQNHLINPSQLEESIGQWQKEAENNWQLWVNDVTGFSDRLTKAAQAAWDILTEENNDNPPQD
ncbi:MAG: hypothetical protein F6K09_08750 [Merismopedia sp. SIO2A8]|nr:hypothetical protein [Merismopedia sp. SIO2A8]